MCNVIGIENVRFLKEDFDQSVNK